MRTFESSDVVFGEGAVDRIKKRVEAISTLRKVKQLFWQVGTQERGLPVYRRKHGQYPFYPQEPHLPKPFALKDK